jgi:hypothetical protein
VWLPGARHVLRDHADGDGELGEGPVLDVRHRSEAAAEVLRPPELVLGEAPFDAILALRASLQSEPASVGEEGCA